MLVDWPPDTAADLRIRDAQTALRGGRGTRAGACTPAEQARQMAAEVAAALHLGKIALPVLGELEMMVGVCVGGLGVKLIVLIHRQGSRALDLWLPTMIAPLTGTEPPSGALNLAEPLVSRLASGAEQTSPRWRRSRPCSWGWRGMARATDGHRR